MSSLCTGLSVPSYTIAGPLNHTTCDQAHSKSTLGLADLVLGDHHAVEHSMLFDVIRVGCMSHCIHTDQSIYLRPQHSGAV